MEISELLKRVKRIEIKSKGLSQNIFSGQYHSAFKGRGMAFSEVREYVPGDDIRNIDWNVTARFDAPYVKVYEEERELTVILMIDVSASTSFGMINDYKKNIIAEIAATIAFSANQNNDKIGVIFFSDKVEKFIPPKKGKSHILRIIREIIATEKTGADSNLNEPIRFLFQAIKKRSTVFILSDFLLPLNFYDALKICAKKHDIIAIKINDKVEKELPDVGLLPIKNLESRAIQWIDTSDKHFRTQYTANFLKHSNELKQIFQKAKVDSTEIFTHQNYVIPLSLLFKNR
ncbi:MAG: hypothetical protein KatS3mg027_0582 [Bacteroidia bacterium]|nr:MAG: hypothetical protein KatS3mg027_0582 [Bacteroidia bacterium]